MVLPLPEPNNEEKLEKEAEDWDTPFSTPDTTKSDMAMAQQDSVIVDANRAGDRIDSAHPDTDTDIDETEWYNAGLAAAAGAAEPQAANKVVGYKKPGDRVKVGGNMAMTRQREAAKENVKKV